MFDDFKDEWKSRGWTDTPAKILNNEVEVNSSKDEPFSLVVKYQYVWKGKAYTGDRISLSDDAYSDYRDAYEELQLVTQKQPFLCKVNPDDPKQAKLRNKSMVGMFGIVGFIMIFILIGLGCIYGGAMGVFSKSKKKPRMVKKPAEKNKGIFIGLIFGGVFFVAGLFMFYFLWLGPFLKTQAAKEWTEVPCKVKYSKLREHTDDEGTTYSVDVFYEYLIAGNVYKSNRYSFAIGSSNIGVKRKREAVRYYRKNKNSICYVDPSDHWNAVLKRDGSSPWYLALFAGVFIAVGGGIMLSSIFGKKRQQSTFRKNETPEALGQQRTLTGGGKRLRAFLFLMLFSLIWNGITYGWLRGEAPGFFFYIFVAAGAAMGLACVYKLLALFNAKVDITLGNDECSIGETLQLNWRMSSTRAERLLITLQCIEEASYRRGTDTVTVHEHCAVFCVVDTTRDIEMQSGKANIAIPMNLMPSWKADSNSIIWKILVEGDVKFWPNIKEEYKIRINPPKT